MGKKNRKRYKDPILCEIEERERIKQSVLQVFRARYSVPSSSGAIVIGKDKPSCIDLTKSKTVHEVEGESSSSMTESESSTSSDKKTNKKRRRRKRQKPQRKVKKVETTDRHDVAKHLKIANDVSHILRPTIDSSKVSSICQNRLTRKMGLFNAGKKSSTISREIYIPDAVKKKTQEDLKKILNQSDKEDDNQSHDDQMNISHSPLILPKPSYRASTTNSNKRSDLGYRSAGSNSITPSSPKIRTTVGSASCLSAASSEDLREILPEEPPMEDISELLIKNLNLKQFFPGRNLFEETVEELRKIMKQNSFSSTPISKKLHVQQVDSVKRSLLDVYSPAKQQGNVKVPSRPSSVKITSSTNMSKSPRMSKIQPCTTMHKSTRSSMNCEKYLFPKTNAITYESASQEKQYLDGKTLINRCNNPPIYSMANISHKHSSTVTQSPRKYLRKDSDAKTLLKCNDKMIAEACHQMEQLASKPQPMETDDSNTSDSNALNLLKQDEAKKMRRQVSYHGYTLREIQRDILSLLPDDIAQNSSQSSGYQGSQNSRYGHEEQTSRIADQTTRNTTYMPQFHTNNHGDGNVTDYKENVCENMDILDYLDGPPPQPETRVRKQTNPRQVKSTTDTDGIQMWVPPNVHVVLLPKKPTFESPSPEKMRPRFMH
ncbi:uncharacterized protein LOC134685324 [Mytilus trossulus]|uniref:uncharacterized protein LOC134685324 n=1 Tax=Mytilus trossulus TaxID=6551 RepID=UPI0030061E37